MDRAIESTTVSGTLDRGPSQLEGLLVAGTYRVSAHLGGGGMGEVYQAEHVRLGSPVAIKFLRAGADADARSSGRFHHEARRAATIRSEHVVRVFDYGQLDDGTPYLVMERLFGEDLRGLLQREASLPIRRAVQLVLGACRGLSVVHAAGLVHRDLKPANLFVEQALDGTEICKILDFGVAKALESDTTRPGSLVGTVRYMAPEQLEDAASTALTADIYALGAILYECVTGVPAHQGATLEETMFNIVHRGVPKPSVHRPVPEPLEAALMRALARDPAHRFASMDDFARALVPFGQLPRALAVSARPDEATLDETRAPRTRRVAFGSLPIAVAAAAAGTLVGWVLRGEAPERSEARMGRALARAGEPAALPSAVTPAPAPTLALGDLALAVGSDSTAPDAPPSARPRGSTPAPRPISARPISTPPPSASARGGLRLEVDNPYAR